MAESGPEYRFPTLSPTVLIPHPPRIDTARARSSVHFILAPGEGLGLGFPGAVLPDISSLDR